MKKNKVENLTSEKVVLTTDDSLLINTEQLFSKDIWYSEKDLGLQTHQHSPIKHLNFSLIKQSWLKQKAKQYIIQKKIQGIKISTLSNYILMFNNLSRFIERKSLNCFSEINENILDLFVKEISQKSQSYRQTHIGSLKEFLETGNIEGWFEISTYTLKEYSKNKQCNQGKINYIPDEVLQQLDENLHFFPEPIQRLVVLMKTLGLRSCEALNMKFDCLKQHQDGNWDIEFVNWKFQDKLDRLPINEDLVFLIKQQQKYIQDNLGNDFELLFCGNKLGYALKKEGEVIPFLPVAKTLTRQSFNRYLNKLAKSCQITDKTGKIFKFTTHQFRRTVATKMANEGVRTYIIQCYLRHHSPAMIKHYIELLPNTIKKEMEAFRKTSKIIDITGAEIEPKKVSGDDYILEWLREKMQPRALSMGFCQRPKLLKPCPHANTCMSCEHFRLNEDDLPALKQHLERNRQLKSESIKKGYQRQIDIIEQDENQLIKLINSLEDKNN